MERYLGFNGDICWVYNRDIIAIHWIAGMFFLTNHLVEEGIRPTYFFYFCWLRIPTTWPIPSDKHPDFGSYVMTFWTITSLIGERPVNHVWLLEGLIMLYVMNIVYNYIIIVNIISSISHVHRHQKDVEKSNPTEIVTTYFSIRGLVYISCNVFPHRLFMDPCRSNWRSCCSHGRAAAATSGHKQGADLFPRFSMGLMTFNGIQWDSMALMAYNWIQSVWPYSMGFNGI